MVKKALARLIVLAVVLLLAGMAFLVRARLDVRPRTDDAFIEADIAHLAPEVSGQIVSMEVRNNQNVVAGQTLFVVDPRPYELKLAQIRAQSRALETRIDDALNEVASQTSRADAAHTAIEGARVQLALAASTLARQEPLLEKGFVTADQVDRARSARDAARVGLTQAMEQAEAARQAISSIHPLEAQLEASRAGEALAERDLEKTVVKAPFAGRVAGLNVTTGEYAVAGHPLFTLIDTGRWYAVANFRETELIGLTEGQAATVYSMARPSLPLAGHLESIGWGVLPEDAARTGDLPKIAKTLDWVRLAQRFPVRIRLDQPPPDLMRIGLSAVVVVHRDQPH